MRFPHDPRHHHHHHHHFHRHWRWRDELGRYYGKHLHKRLFFWFTASIFVTALISIAFFKLSWRLGVFGEGIPKGVMFLVPVLTIWAVSGKIARRIARPLDDLGRVAERIGQGELGARAEPDRGPHPIQEIVLLGRTINEMAGRIERHMKDQRELLAAVSHELRTPLARVRVLLEIAREGGSPGLPPQKILDELEREAEEMDQLVGELLASARLDFQALTPRPLEAVDVARRALERAGLAAELLTVEAAAPIPFKGDPTLLARALANLIDNARKHGRGLARLAIVAEAGKVVFLVDDRGPGFPESQADGQFRPFVRNGGAASGGGEQSPEASGLGLGLALVARIARAHGGRLEARNRPEGGAQVRLELPTG